MSLTGLAGLGGIGFVLLAIGVNVSYVRGGLPLPNSGRGPAAFASVGDALRRPSVLAPASWLCLTVFAAGLLSVLGHDDARPAGWALVGFAGVLMQNVTFAVVEALRFGLAAAARDGGGSTAGLWSLNNVLFAFNQAFLATALAGFTAAGTGAGLVPGWQAWLGYASAVLLFVSASAGPYSTEGTSRIAVVGLAGWLGWIAWIVAYGVMLLRLG